MQGETFYLCLAFAYTKQDPKPGMASALLRSMRGPYEHVELSISDESGETWRVIVHQHADAAARAAVPKQSVAQMLWSYLRGLPPVLPARTERRVERTRRVYQDKVEFTWRYLRLQCTKERIVLINDELNRHARDYFSWRAMYASGWPPMPAWLVAALVPEHAPTALEGNATYCTRLCVQALQAAGYLEHYPADLLTASDLYILAVTRLPVEETIKPMVRGLIRERMDGATIWV